MILWKSKINRNVRECAKDSISGFRTVFEVGFFSNWRDGWGIGFVSQYQEKDTGEWHLASHYHEMTITPHWRWGREHIYYDGPHDSFSLGFIHFVWSGAWCQKCADGEP